MKKHSIRRNSVLCTYVKIKTAEISIVMIRHKNKKIGLFRAVLYPEWIFSTLNIVWIENHPEMMYIYFLAYCPTTSIFCRIMVLVHFWVHTEKWYNIISLLPSTQRKLRFKAKLNLYVRKFRICFAFEIGERQ